LNSSPQHSHGRGAHISAASRLVVQDRRLVEGWAAGRGAAGHGDAGAVDKCARRPTDVAAARL
jgi:hypothetical protein